ncbi:hypothetical protein [Arthrobacter sp. UYCo732]|uniref:hypothetical protein n=1 Tax=Arthrobacter sp. UYCo732 TaxID=3156336 RepID=UPI00339A13C6
MLRDFTALLVSLNFVSAGESLEGHQHRWLRGEAMVDVLIPRHLGERADGRRGVTGGTTIAAPATQQALDRAETIDVSADSASGNVNRPTLLGCLLGKAAALGIMNDPGRERHITDFLTLAAVIRASDLRGVTYKPAERDHLANMLGHLANNPPPRHSSGTGGCARGRALTHVAELTDGERSLSLRTHDRHDLDRHDP